MRWCPKTSHKCTLAAYEDKETRHKPYKAADIFASYVFAFRVQLCFCLQSSALSFGLILETGQQIPSAGWRHQQNHKLLCCGFHSQKHTLSTCFSHLEHITLLRRSMSKSCLWLLLYFCSFSSKEKGEPPNLEVWGDIAIHSTTGPAQDGTHQIKYISVYHLGPLEIDCSYILKWVYINCNYEQKVWCVTLK